MSVFEMLLLIAMVMAQASFATRSMARTMR
jgi:hypothetical protein